MKVKIFLLLSVLILGLAAIGIGTDADFSSLLDQISPAVVSVHSLIDPEEGTWATASGFIVDPHGVVITACHAVLNAAEVIVELRDGTSYRATVERCSDDDLEAKIYDTAVLQLQGVTGYLPQLWLGDSCGVHLGEEVFVLSYPGPYGEFNVVKGEVSGRLPRQYLTLGDEPYRIGLLAQLEVDWGATGEAGWITDVREIVNLNFSHASLADLVAFAEQKETLVIGIREPSEGGLEDLFCGIVADVDVTEQRITVDEADCILLLGLGLVEKTGRRGTLDREVVFLKTSAPLADGSSGGPLVGLTGRALGLVSWSRNLDLDIEEDEEGFIDEIELGYWPGTTYIVPSNLIKSLLESS